jgi:hypothetical protein
LGSFIGDGGAESGEKTFDLPKLKGNEAYVFTLILDNMGYDENWVVGRDDMKSPRGILDYQLDGHSPEDVMWKITGNLGGEQYLDKTRGPLNEGGMWAERQGYHLPSPPVTDDGWKIISKGPVEGISKAGVAWYVTSFNLNMPKGYDIPLAIRLPNITKHSTRSMKAAAASAYRVQIYVNGWQFGKYVSHLGPQTEYPVPEGIWDYQGTNWVAVSLWAMEESGAKIEDIRLVAGPAIQTGYTGVKKVDALSWSPRSGRY